MKTPNSKLQTPNSKLQTPNSKLQTPNSKLQTPNSKLLIVSCIIFLLIYGANIMFPVTFDDDFAYAEAGNPFYLQYLEYLNWHGRYITHTIGRIILQLRDPLANILTALVGMFFVFSIANIMKSVRGRNAFAALIPISLSLSCIVGSWTGYTQTVSLVSYQLSCAFIMCFLYFYFERINNPDYNTPFWLIALSGFAAGCSYEQSAALLPLLILMYLFIRYIQKQKIPSWFYIGAGAFTIGLMILLLTPANLAGARDGYASTDNWQFMGQSYNWHELGFERYFYALANVMLFGSNPWLLPAVPLSVAFCVLFRKNLKIEKDWTKQAPALFMIILSWGLASVMMFSPMFWYAQYNFALIFMYTALGMIIKHRLDINPASFIWIKRLTVFCCALAVGIWLFLVPVWLNYRGEYYALADKIEYAKANNINEVETRPFSQYKINTPFGAIIPVYLYTSPGFYRRMARYYGIDKITVIK